MSWNEVKFARAVGDLGILPVRGLESELVFNQPL